MNRYENTRPGHNKFWEIEVVGCEVRVLFGRIGTSGQGQTKQFSTDDDAAQYGEDKINEKLRGGYVQR